MSGPFDFLHIKRRTVGSSNELSFDVLDAARDGVDSKKGHGSRVVAGPKPSQGSYHGVAGTSTLSAAPEVERRKKARRAHTRRIWVMAVIAVVTLVGAAGYFGYTYYQTKVDFNGKFNVLIERFVDIDKKLVDVDALMKNPLAMIGGTTSSKDEQETTSDENNKEASELATDYSGLFTSMKRELNAITAEAQAMKKQASNDEEKSSLSQLESASNARINMIFCAEEAFEIAENANVRVERTKKAWDKVMSADEMARTAAEEANEAGTEEATIEARTITESSRELFIEAQGDLQAIGDDNPKVSFENERAYIEKRVESLDAAIKTANALLSNNKEGAISANNEYNAADKEAASLAANLPSSEEEKVARAYKIQLEKISAEYENHRSTASTADSAIRAYLNGR